MPKWIAYIVGKFIGNKLNLQEDTKMDGSKKWYQSKTVWAGVVSVLIAGYSAAASAFGLPVIPEWVFAILGTIGIYSRVTATNKIN